VWANDPIVSPAMRALGVARGTFDRSVRRDSRLEQLFREEKWEELVSVFKGREEPKRTKRQLKKDLSELYSEVSAGDSFVRDNFSAKKLQNLLLEKQKKPRLQKVQEALQDSYKRQEYSEMLETIKGYLRTVPRIILPIIWKEFVKPVVPEWNYESFSNIVKTNKLIMAAIATNEEGEIKRFVEVYRSKFEKGSFYRPR
jgi:hypothetical protein